MKKTLIVLFVAIIIIAGAFYLLRKPKVGQNIAPNTPSGSTETSSTTPSVSKTSSETSINPKIATNIAIENFSFKPAELKVKKGDTVTWVNHDSAPHRIKGDSFQSGILNKGQGFSFTFGSDGTFNYICAIHPYMKGKIIVE